MLVLILGTGIAALRGQEPAGVEDAQIRCAQMFGQPLDTDQIARLTHCHRNPSTL